MYYMRINMAKAVSVFVSVLVLFHARSSKAADYGAGVSPLKKWNIVLPNDPLMFEEKDTDENCMVFLRKAKHSKPSWAFFLDDLFGKLKEAAAKGDSKVFKSCFAAGKAPKGKKLAQEMRKLKNFAHYWTMKSCAWGESRSGALWFLAVSTLEPRMDSFDGPNSETKGDYSITHYRRIFYAVKENGKFKFITGTVNSSSRKVKIGSAETYVIGTDNL